MNYPTADEMRTRTAGQRGASADRLNARYVVEANGCWRWTGSITTTGYGHFSINRVYFQAHRLMYILHRGPIAERDLDHLCRNRACVNPDHLEPVTHRENMRRGPRVRLTPERVQLIHELADRGFSQRQIGRLLTVDHSTVCRVLAGQRWSEYAPQRRVA